MADLSGIGSIGKGMLMSWGFWLLLGIVILGVGVGSLYMRKKGKFNFPAVIFTDNGGGKVGLKFTRCGWFKSQKILGGLIDYAGERRLEVKDGRIVQQGSSTDFHEIRFRTGLLLMEKHDDPKVLVPINKCALSNESRKMLFEIAPADYRDACSKIIVDAEKESLSKWEQMAQVLVFGLVAMVLFISIILTINYAKNTMADANAIHKEALSFYEKVLQRSSTVQSTTAP
jgi:hypothetical protein